MGTNSSPRTITFTLADNEGVTPESVEYIGKILILPHYLSYIYRDEASLAGAGANIWED